MARPTSAARDRLITAQAARAERINQIETGELVPADQVKSEWLDITTQIRIRLSAIPARVAALHPGHPEIIATLERELHSALNSLADDEL